MENQNPVKVVATVALVLLGLGLWLGRPWLYWTGFGLLAAGIFFSPFAELFSFLWLKLGHLLGAINSRIILTVVFFLFLTPLSVIYRLFGKNTLQLKRKKEGSYFVSRELKYGQKDLGKMW